tara:strand:- start:458 stop:688 length:231 start_codon:yes stop_codon:yes gene_type:complete
MIACYKYPHGISLNGRDYLLDGDEVALFENEQELFDFINRDVGYIAVTSVKDLEENGVYIEDADQTEEWFENDTIH